MNSFNYLRAYEKFPAEDTSNKKSKLGKNVKVNLSPTESELQDLSYLLNAIDLLIAFNCFSDQNPLRSSQNMTESLVWSWAIVTVGEINIPAPIPFKSDIGTTLYTYRDEMVYLGAEECAITTAVFYFNHLIHMIFEWKELSPELFPLHASLIRAGLNELNHHGEHSLLDALEMLKDELSPLGWKVLN